MPKQLSNPSVSFKQAPQQHATLSVSNSLVGGKNVVQIILLLGKRLEYEHSGYKLVLASSLTINIFGARKQTFVHLSKQPCLSGEEFGSEYPVCTRFMFWGDSLWSDFMD